LIFTSKRWTIRQFFRLLAVKAYQFITFNYFYDSMDLPLMQDFNVVDVVTWLLPDVLYDAKRSNMSMAIRNSSTMGTWLVPATRLRATGCGRARVNGFVNDSL